MRKTHEIINEAADQGYKSINSIDKIDDVVTRANGYRKLALEAMYALSVVAPILQDHEETKAFVLKELENA